MGLDHRYKPRGIESTNLEEFMYENTICPTLPQMVAPFKVIRIRHSSTFPDKFRDNYLVIDQVLRQCEFDFS